MYVLTCYKQKYYIFKKGNSLGQIMSESESYEELEIAKNRLPLLGG